MENEKREKTKAKNTKKKYNELLEMQKEIKKELNPLKQYLIQMGKIEKVVKKKEV